MSTHTAIATTSKGIIDAIQVPTTKPGPGEILLKNAFSSMIAFDTYMADLGYAVQEYPAILGFNASGTVAEVGPGVTDLAVGDRVSIETRGVYRVTVCLKCLLKDHSFCISKYTGKSYAAIQHLADCFMRKSTKSDAFSS